MSTLSNIFATEDADEAQTVSSDQAADEAAIAPGTPGYEPDDPNIDPPAVLLPGEPGDPTV